MKETIEQAAKEYADGLRSVDKKNTYDNIEVDSSRMVAFKRGAEWQAKQSPWISIEDAIPKESAKGLAKVKYLDGSEGEMVMGHISKWVYPYIKAGYVTHWCQIPE